MVTDFQRLIESLTDAQVEFVLIGGVALVLHGSGRVTQDLGICYRRKLENYGKLVQALKPWHPRLRGAPPGLPFLFDEQTLRSGLNFTLTTDLGDLDLLGEVPGLGTFEAIQPDVESFLAYGRRVLLLNLDQLQRSKHAAGRLKDLADLAEIEAIRQRQKRS